MSTPLNTLYITHPACRLHDMGTGHPECPARLDAIEDQLLMSGVSNILAQETPVQAADEDLLRVHTARHIQFLRQQAPESGRAAIDPDTIMNPRTLEAAYAAAGAGIVAVNAVMAGHHDTAFCAVRPPGHHASPARASGFCFFNNVAVAAAYALEVHDLERVAIIDFDVHHGNGTEDIFAGDERVLMCGFYQYPFYPGSRHEPPAANMHNTPVNAGTSGTELRAIVRDDWLPRLYDYQPQLVLISAGFDAHREDDLGQLGMVEADYAWITTQIVELAQHTAQGRVISLLEGGYNLSALGRSVVAHIKALSKL